MKLIEWKVVTGCERLTPGCDNCPTYWEYEKNGWDYTPAIQPVHMNEPLDNQEPSTYLVASGSDLFHESVPVEFIQAVFTRMRQANWHDFEVLTKRAERLERLSDAKLLWPNNVRAVVAVEEAKYKWRIDCLRTVKAHRFVSFGPMTGRIGKVDLTGIEGAGVVVEDWGPDPRPIKPEWIEEINMQCEEQGVLLATNKWVVGEEV
jgi:protein gp37